MQRPKSPLEAEVSKEKCVINTTILWLLLISMIQSSDTNYYDTGEVLLEYWSKMFAQQRKEPAPLFLARIQILTH
jgi:hypothetical protein